MKIEVGPSHNHIGGGRSSLPPWLAIVVILILLYLASKGIVSF